MAIINVGSVVYSGKNGQFNTNRADYDGTIFRYEESIKITASSAVFSNSQLSAGEEIILKINNVECKSSTFTAPRIYIEKDTDFSKCTLSGQVYRDVDPQRISYLEKWDGHPSSIFKKYIDYVTVYPEKSASFGNCKLGSEVRIDGLLQESQNTQLLQKNELKAIFLKYMDYLSTGTTFLTSGTPKEASEFFFHAANKQQELFRNGAGAEKSTIFYECLVNKAISASCSKDDIIKYSESGSLYPVQKCDIDIQAAGEQLIEQIF